MIVEQLSHKVLITGILSLAMGACAGSNPGADGTGGSSNAQATGGTANGGLTASSTSSATGHDTGGVTGSGGNSQQPMTGGAPGTGGTTASAIETGGNPATGGTKTGAGGFGKGGTGGKSTGGAQSTPASGGSMGTGGASSGNTGGADATGGKTSVATTLQATGGQTGIGGGAGGTKATGGSTAVNTGTSSGTCTASKATGTNVSGSGPHKVTMETNADPGIKEGTIYRPTDLGGGEKYPIFVWGEGGCSLNGLSNSVAMGEIASHGYFVIADGTPNNSSSRSMDSSNPTAMGKPLLAYIDWAIAENEKPCSAYYHSLDTTKIASNGFSCGGLMAEGTAGDPRMTTWGLNSSGMFSANQAFYKTIHTPVLIVLGGPSDIAYENGERDYDNISALGIPIMLFSKDIGHGGDLFSSRGGDFTKIDLAWLNWWLKGDETATGKGLLVGTGCTYCTNSAWEVKSKNLP